MKRLLPSLLIIPLLLNPVQSKTLRIELSADLIGNDVKSRIFQAELLLSEGGGHEIFTGPYTVELYFNGSESGQYDFKADLYGLAPEYNISEYDLSLKPGEKMLIPSLPVKGGINVNYIIALIDDTSAAGPAQYSLKDSSLWGFSETIHYSTRWVKASLIDFKWNTVMSYLEFIYNKYRESYRLSEFKRIDMYIHPEPTDEVYMDGEYFYAIQPKSRRIDLVYGHNIQAATPAPACELLVYRLWGYGPRWMVKGLARYYNDNMLQIRDYVKDLDKTEILNLLKNENRIRNDMESAVAGALVFWLLQNESFIEFKNLYARSTVIDFENKFEDVYKYPFDEMLDRFLDYARDYLPTEGELDYYALLYFERGYMARAEKYYKELSIHDDADRMANLKKLAACRFWLGKYAAADSVYDFLFEFGEQSPENLFMKGEVKLAEGKVDEAIAFYDSSYEKGFATGRLRIVSILTDRGEIDSAYVLLKNMEGNAKRLLDYSIEMAGMKVLRGENADSLLNTAIRGAVNKSNKAPDDPRPYLVMGKAYALMDDYEKSIEQFRTAYFLETSPFNQSFILLEMGRTEDSLGRRERAKDYYRQVIELDGGEYQNTLAKRYLNSTYRRK
ncbi:MAG: hypothetical protein JSU85_06070 [Candidatus Zixiibacteriota bacterium]|nr:MAG: hypothetical protein JSU85_06070 [candidate division Zixibacteria bacterium]